jgi:glycosyltransferase involved in cell wall biosynthesis
MVIKIKMMTLNYKNVLNLNNNYQVILKVSMNSFVKNSEVQKILSKYDLFVLPTCSENFGHVIIESLSVGTPVLISNKVLWKSDKKGGFQTLTLIEEY